MKLDFGCGERTAEGFLGVDLVQTSSTRYVYDLRWPWPKEWRDKVEAGRCHHFFEHLTPRERIHFMNELWLALVPHGRCEFVTPLGMYRMMQDPDHKWPPVVPSTYNYFSRAWLAANGLTHYERTLDIHCNFELAEEPQILLRADQYTEQDRDEKMRFDPDAQTDLRMVVKRMPL